MSNQNDVSFIHNDVTLWVHATWPPGKIEAGENTADTVKGKQATTTTTIKKGGMMINQYWIQFLPP